MSTIVWELQGSLIVSSERQGDDLVLQLEPFYILKALAGSIEKTRWKQQGSLLIKNARLSGEPNLTGTISSGQLTHNAYVYRDEVPMPISVHGEVCLRLLLEETDEALEVKCEQLVLQPRGLEKYVTHISI